MNRHITFGLTAIASAALGAAAVEALHAQAKPPAYIIVENTITNQEAYNKEYAPLIRKSIQEHGGKVLAAGGKTLPISGEPPRGGIAVAQYESRDRAQAFINSSAIKDANAIGSKYATLRAFVVEGLPQ